MKPGLTFDGGGGGGGGRQMRCFIWIDKAKKNLRKRNAHTHREQVNEIRRTNEMLAFVASNDTI